jgi:hypothetical protein
VCVSCHSDPPIGGAVGSLVTYGDLTSPAPGYTNTNMAQAAVARMQDTAKPMPPGPSVTATAAQISTLESWISANFPMGSCGADGGTDTTFTGAPTCPSGSTYGGGEGRSMDPGMACISCHASTGGEAPTFAFAGTVFVDGHATDRCLPGSQEKADLSQATVVITGANGATLSLPLCVPSKSNPSTCNFANGNFSTAQSVPLPYTAKVVYMGKERDMTTPQTRGDCNACHTVTGTNGAPGRIALPQ